MEKSEARTHTSEEWADGPTGPCWQTGTANGSAFVFES